VNLSAGRDTDAWTYYEFGTRSFRDQIRALVLDDLDQATDSDAIDSELREQTTSRALPFVPIPPHAVPSRPKTIDAEGIRYVPLFLLSVDLQEQAIAVAYFRQRPQLLAKIRDRLAREIAYQFTSAFFGTVTRINRVPTATKLAQAVKAMRPDR
jgi:hypothetical protein